MNLQSIIDESLEAELLILIEELKDKHIALGQKASGKWIEGLETAVKGGIGAIIGEGYTQYLIHGRPSGGRPPINPLKEWAKVKLGVSEKEALNVAFAVATKIAREGTDIYKQGGTDLLEDTLTEQRIERIYSNIGGAVSFAISNELVRSL